MAVTLRLLQSLVRGRRSGKERRACHSSPMVTTQHRPSPPTGLSGSSVRIAGPAGLGGQRLQVSQMPKAVSGEEGIHATADSGGVRDLSKRVEVASCCLPPDAAR